MYGNKISAKGKRICILVYLISSNIRAFKQHCIYVFSETLKMAEYIIKDNSLKKQDALDKSSCRIKFLHYAEKISNASKRPLIHDSLAGSWISMCWTGLNTSWNSSYKINWRVKSWVIISWRVRRPLKNLVQSPKLIQTFVG